MRYLAANLGRSSDGGQGSGAQCGGVVLSDDQGRRISLQHGLLAEQGLRSQLHMIHKISQVRKKHRLRIRGMLTIVDKDGAKCVSARLMFLAEEQIYDIAYNMKLVISFLYKTFGYKHTH
jgi:hypothetical protein